MNGIFVISFDFELYWGLKDKRALEKYKKNILGVYSFIPAILKLFKTYKIHATWATIGFLFYESRDQLINDLPKKKPNYLIKKHNPYNYVHKIGLNEKEDPYHYAPSLINLIKSYPNQEIGTHTFSHYYCLEKGQNIETFKDDLKASMKIAKRYNIIFESLVFPRNQYNPKYLIVCRKNGINAIRCNRSTWIYRARKDNKYSLIIKILQYLDSIFNITGHNTYSANDILRFFPFRIYASRFIFCYLRRFKIVEPLLLKRILSDLTYAAKKGEIYHLWGHPHNFGVNIDKNLKFIKKILNHYIFLKKKYGIESLNMKELAHKLKKRTISEKNINSVKMYE